MRGKKRAFCEQWSYKLAISGPISLLVLVAAAGPSFRVLKWGLDEPLLCAYRPYILTELSCNRLNAAVRDADRVGRSGEGFIPLKNVYIPHLG